MDIDSQHFSQREKDVIPLLLQGKSNKQIALDLGIANRTVEFHLSNIYAKLGVNSRSEAILKLAGEGLRESAGEDQRKSTVATGGDSTENGSQPNFRRIVMRKPYYLLGGISVTILIAAFAILRLSTQDVPSQPTLPVQQTIDLINPQTSSPTMPVPTSTESTSERLGVISTTSMAIPHQTVNGYTATIESHYADATHILFQVRLLQQNSASDKWYMLAGPNLYDEYGRLLNASVTWGPAIDPALYQFEFVPTTLLAGNHVKGQFAFEVEDPDDLNQINAQFLFDFDIPIHPEARSYPKQTVTADGLEILLDSVTVTPEFTQFYLCFTPPSADPWNIGSQAVLKIGEQESPLYTSGGLYDSLTGSFWGIRSEPNWMPPAKEKSCFKPGFPIGSTTPVTLTLTIPEIENADTSVFITDQLATDYPGLSKREAYHKYLEDHGRTYKGPWVFTVEFIP